MSNSNYLAGHKTTKTAEGAAKVLKQSYVGHIIQNLVIKNGFTVFLIPKNEFLNTNLS
jgi:hypothetical protein